MAERRDGSTLQATIPGFSGSRGKAGGWRLHDCTGTPTFIASRWSPMAPLGLAKQSSRLRGVTTRRIILPTDPTLPSSPTEPAPWRSGSRRRTAGTRCNSRPLRTGPMSATRNGLRTAVKSPTLPVPRLIQRRMSLSCLPPAGRLRP